MARLAAMNFPTGCTILLLCTVYISPKARLELQLEGVGVGVEEEEEEDGKLLNLGLPKGHLLPQSLLPLHVGSLSLPMQCSGSLSVIGQLYFSTVYDCIS